MPVWTDRRIAAEGYQRVLLVFYVIASRKERGEAESASGFEPNAAILAPIGLSSVLRRMKIALLASTSELGLL